MSRYAGPLIQGLAVALAFLLGWYAPTVLPGLETSGSTPGPSAEKSDTVPTALRGLGYASGYERREGPTGVLKHDSAARDGYNVYTSAHRAQAAIMDMNGDTLHTWSRDFQASFPNADLSERTRRRLKMRPWRKIYPYPNGDLLAIHSSYSIVKLDRDSNLLWSRHNVQHHDMDVGPEGRIYTIASKRAPLTFEGVEKTRLIDTITVYSDTGQRLEEYDLLRALEQSDYSGLMGFFGPDQNELFHTNSVDVLPDGDLLLSILHLHSLARLDLDTGRFEWMLTGRTSHQHDAQYIGNGRITLFDNRRFMQASRALEMDLQSEEIQWSYDGGQDNPFYSWCCGTVQRLDGGNTLVNDSDSGRVFEVTRDGRVVWEWVNPHENEEGKVATTFEFRRFPVDYFSFLRDGT